MRGYVCVRAREYSARQYLEVRSFLQDSLEDDQEEIGLHAPLVNLQPRRLYEETRKHPWFTPDPSLYCVCEQFNVCVASNDAVTCADTQRMVHSE